MNHPRIASVASHLPDGVLTTRTLEDRLRARSPLLDLPVGLLERLTGVTERREAGADQQASDLAVAAARRALARASLDPAAIDLLVYAGATPDLLEPATAHIVQDKLGTNAVVFDVRNACNSFSSGLAVAEALLASGAHENALVVCGETPTRAMRFDVEDSDALRRVFPGLSLGDAGGAMVLTRTGPGLHVVHRRTHARSRHWSAVTLAGGGSMHGSSAEHAFIAGDGLALKRAFEEFAADELDVFLHEVALGREDFRRVFVHQVTLPWLRSLCAITGIDLARVEVTVPRFGNVAAASFPLQLSRALEQRRLAPGDRALWIGLAAGAELTLVVLEVRS